MTRGYATLIACIGLVVSNFWLKTDHPHAWVLALSGGILVGLAVSLAKDKEDGE